MPGHTKYFKVVDAAREDFYEAAGNNRRLASYLNDNIKNDKTLRKIAQRAGEYLVENEAYWNALELAL